VTIILLKLLSTYISAESEEAHRKLPLSSVVFHHDRTSPIQYELFLAEVFSQLISCLLSDGRPMSEKTANDLPPVKHWLLALNHDNEDDP